MKKHSLIVSAYALCLSSFLTAEVIQQPRQPGKFPQPPRPGSAGVTATMPLSIQQPSTDSLIDFLELEKRQKEDWLNFAKKKHVEKYDLLIKHHDEMFDSHINHVKQMANVNGFASRQTAIDSKLQDMISMHEAHMEEWKNMCDKDRTEAEALYTKHKAEVDEFKASQGQKPIKAPQWSRKETAN